MSIFIIIGGVGLIVLSFGILFDGVFDVLDDTIVPALGVGLTVFGASGLISSSLTGSTVSNTHVFLTSFIFSTVLTLIFVFSWKFIKRRNNSENLVEIGLNSILGTTGEVIRWGENGGEAIFKYLGGSTKVDIITENESLSFGDKVRAVKEVDKKFIVKKIEKE